MALLKLKEDHALRFSIKAARRFKATYGKSLWQVQLSSDGQPLPEFIDPDCLVHVVSAGLLAENPKMTADKAEALLDQYLSAGGDLKNVYNSIAEAFRESGLFGREDEAEAPNE